MEIIEIKECKQEKLELIKSNSAELPSQSLKLEKNIHSYNPIEVLPSNPIDFFSKKEIYVYLKLLQMDFDKDICEFVLTNNTALFNEDNDIMNIIPILIDLILQEQEKRVMQPIKKKKISQKLEIFKKVLPLQLFLNKKKEKNRKKNYYSIEEEKLIELEPEIVENCEICCVSFEKKQWDDLGACYKISPCGHKYCKNCVFCYLEDKIKSGNVLNIKCLDHNCENILTDSEIERMVDDNVLFKKFKKFKKIKELSQDPSVCWCINQNCERYNKGSKEKPKVVCECGTVVCFNCLGRWHEGISCKKALDKEYQEYARKMQVKLCPRCKSRIEKNEGCNHMTCMKCHYEFCWICLKKYKSNHFNSNFNFYGCNQNGTERRKHLFCKFLIELLQKFFVILLCSICLSVGFIIFLPFYLIFSSVFLLAVPWLILEKYYGIPYFELKFLLLKILLVPIIYPFALAFAIMPGSFIEFYYFVNQRFQILQRENLLLA